MKYGEYLIQSLLNLGYTHCFFVAGGNSMHLLDAARKNMQCTPFVHEVSATIAAEYFNEVSQGVASRAFVLVTAGPGLTNALTGIAGAFLESRELLVIGGQVKSSDLARGELRQRGIQEVDGVRLASSITKASVLVDAPLTGQQLHDVLDLVDGGRPGPVFLEICLDIQAREVSDVPLHNHCVTDSQNASISQINQIRSLLTAAARPILLVGGGLAYRHRELLCELLKIVQIPVMTTWNGADRISFDHDLYLGRPNTWGQRSSNVILQQADVVLALGTRLGLQQTGFNWREFLPHAYLIQVDIDQRELKKSHPVVDLPVCADAGHVLNGLFEIGPHSWPEWTSFGRYVRTLLPLSEAANQTTENFYNTFDFVLDLSAQTNENDIIVPCSSGGAFTVMMQAFLQKRGQRLITNKGLASMGYGLAGAVGAAMAARERRVVLVEGDGGFSQNLQELATVSRHNLNVKIFIFVNNGYASIRMTQLNYFNGEYLGCDSQTGLGFPAWDLLARAFGIGWVQMDPGCWNRRNVQALWNSEKPAIFIVPVDPQQTYFPKISSQISDDGSMKSAPLHLMTPDLSDDLKKAIFKYI